MLLKQSLTEFRGEIDSHTWRFATPFSAQVMGLAESQRAEDRGPHAPGSTQRAPLTATAPVRPCAAPQAGSVQL